MNRHWDAPPGFKWALRGTLLHPEIVFPICFERILQKLFWKTYVYPSLSSTPDPVEGPNDSIPKT